MAIETAARIEEIYRLNDEEFKKPFFARGILQYPTIENIFLRDLKDQIDTIKNCIKCQRFPESVKKRKDDKCGEYRKKK